MSNSAEACPAIDKWLLTVMPRTLMLWCYILTKPMKQYDLLWEWCVQELSESELPIVLIMVMPLNSATSSDYQFRSGGKQIHHNVLYQVFFRRRSRLERFLLVVSACLVVVVVILLAVIASHDHDVPSSQSHNNKSPPLPTSPTGRISVTLHTSVV